jgi:hypothetical protein
VVLFKILAMEYYIVWIDKYKKGYRSGVTHAVADDGKDKSLCGIDFNNHHMDGGYETTNKLKPECKKCLRALEILNKTCT